MFLSGQDQGEITFPYLALAIVGDQESFTVYHIIHVFEWVLVKRGMPPGLDGEDPE